MRPSSLLLSLFGLVSGPTAAALTADASSYFSQLPVEDTAAYTQWLESSVETYPRHVFLPAASNSGDGAAVFWRIDDDVSVLAETRSFLPDEPPAGSKIHLAIAVPADGWVGFGISEAGGMKGSDMALYEATSGKLTDAHVKDSQSMPLLDECHDWKLEAATDEDGWLIVEMSRLLDTGDLQDHSLKDDSDIVSSPTRLIAAWGNEEEASFHGEKNARGAVRLFSDSNVSEIEFLTAKLEAESDGYFDIVQDDHPITSYVDTEYHDLCKTFDDLNLDLPEGQTDVTIIGATPVLDDDTAKYVHHFTVYQQANCDNSFTMQRSMITVWAPGSWGMAMPSNVGMPMFDSPGNHAININIHYDNPNLDKDLRDSSGMRYYYTLNKREHDAGILEVGDPILGLNGETINAGLTNFQFTCPGQCSETFLGDDKVTVLSEMLHMHQTGVRMTNEVIRDGQVVHLATAETYDFSQQGGIQVQQPTYELESGDSFRTNCFYKHESEAKFGRASSDEMCIAFLLYYPAKKIQGYPWFCPYIPEDWGMPDRTGCRGEVPISNDLLSDEELLRTFGKPGSTCNLGSDTPVSIEDKEDTNDGEDDQPLTDVEIESGKDNSASGLCFQKLTLLGFAIVASAMHK